MAKTKALISFAVTAKLICVFVFAYAKIRFSHVAGAHICSAQNEIRYNSRMVPAQGRNPHFVARSENSYLAQYHSIIARGQSGNGGQSENILCDSPFLVFYHSW